MVAGAGGRWQVKEPPGEPEVLGDLHGRVGGDQLLLVEEVPVDLPAAEQPDVRVVGNGALGRRPYAFFIFISKPV